MIDLNLSSKGFQARAASIDAVQRGPAIPLSGYKFRKLGPEHTFILLDKYMSSLAAEFQDILIDIDK